MTIRIPSDKEVADEARVAWVEALCNVSEPELISQVAEFFSDVIDVLEDDPRAKAKLWAARRAFLKADDGTPDEK